MCRRRRGCLDEHELATRSQSEVGDRAACRPSDLPLEGAVAIRCNNLPVLSYKLDQLLADPHRFSSMQTNARKMGRPNAAKEIVDRITELTA